MTSANEKATAQTVAISNSQQQLTSTPIFGQLAEQGKYSHLPGQMRNAKRWIVWKLVPQAKGKPKKVPFYVSGTQRNGMLDTPDDVAQFGTLADAMSALKTGRYTGLGFALGPDGTGNYWQGIDLDHLPEHPELQTIADDLPGYTERSPSGDGLHAIGYGRDFHTMRSNTTGIEAYSYGRYFTVTADSAGGGDVCELADFVEGVLRPLHGQQNPRQPKHRQEVKNDAGSTISAADCIDQQTVDDLRSALQSMNADEYGTWIENGQRLKSLGDTGRELWLAWSATSPRFDENEAAHKWETFTGIKSGYAGVFSAAQVLGWKNPRKGEDATKGLEDLIDQAKTTPERRYKPLGSAALAALPPLTWRVRGVLPAQGLAAIYGPSGSGKSFLAIDLCAAVARGRSWFGKHVTGAPVTYLALEGEGGIRLRVQAWEKHHGEPLPDGLTFILQSFDMSSRQDLADLLAVLPAGGVVIIDTLNRAAPCVDENSSKDMGQVLTAAKAIQVHTAGLVVLVHHTGKDQTKGLRGHSSLHAALDGAIEVQRVAGWRSWSVAKAKDGEDGGSYTFDLKPVEVGQDEYGFTESSRVIVPAVVDAVAEPKLTGGQALALAAFDAADLGLGAVAREDWRREFYDMLGDRTSEAKRQAFSRSITALVGGGVLSQTDDLFARASFF